jgi:steroid 5-alpha reductase family enzyme
MWTYEIAIILLKNLGFLLALSALLWIFCISLSNISIIDRFWGPLCAASGTFTLIQTNVFSDHAVILVALSGVWAIRLAWYITLKNWNAGQDARYDDETSPGITRARGPFGTLIFVFFGQATLAWLISAPIQLGQFYTDIAGQSLSILAYIGVGVWTVGFLFEAIGDWQLRRFKLNPDNKGKIMDQGLWAWTRHPNYFGDSVVWFGLLLIALENPLGIYSIFGPLIMLYFLTKQTGRDFTKRIMLAKYPVEYAEYIERTSGFFPLPPSRR